MAVAETRATNDLAPSTSNLPDNATDVATSCRVRFRCHNRGHRGRNAICARYRGLILRVSHLLYLLGILATRR
jgi:hypothetical protein